MSSQRDSTSKLSPRNDTPDLTDPQQQQNLQQELRSLQPGQDLNHLYGSNSKDESYKDDTVRIIHEDLRNQDAEFMGESNAEESPNNSNDNELFRDQKGNMLESEEVANYINAVKEALDEMYEEKLIKLEAEHQDEKNELLAIIHQLRNEKNILEEQLALERMSAQAAKKERENDPKIEHVEEKDHNLEAQNKEMVKNLELKYEQKYQELEMKLVQKFQIESQDYMEKLDSEMQEILLTKGITKERIQELEQEVRAEFESKLALSTKGQNEGGSSTASLNDPNLERAMKNELKKKQRLLEVNFKRKLKTEVGKIKQSLQLEYEEKERALRKQVEEEKLEVSRKRSSLNIKSKKLMELKTELENEQRVKESQYQKLIEDLKAKLSKAVEKRDSAMEASNKLRVQISDLERNLRAKSVSNENSKPSEAESFRQNSNKWSKKLRLRIDDGDMKSSRLSDLNNQLEAKNHNSGVNDLQLQFDSKLTQSNEFGNRQTFGLVNSDLRKLSDVSGEGTERDPSELKQNNINFKPLGGGEIQVNMFHKGSGDQNEGDEPAGFLDLRNKPVSSIKANGTPLISVDNLNLNLRGLELGSTSLLSKNLSDYSVNQNRRFQLHSNSYNFLQGPHPPQTQSIHAHQGTGNFVGAENHFQRFGSGQLQSLDPGFEKTPFEQNNNIANVENNDPGDLKIQSGNMKSLADLLIKKYFQEQEDPSGNRAACNTNSQHYGINLSNYLKSPQPEINNNAPVPAPEPPRHLSERIEAPQTSFLNKERFELNAESIFARPERSKSHNFNNDNLSSNKSLTNLIGSQLPVTDYAKKSSVSVHKAVSSIKGENLSEDQPERDHYEERPHHNYHHQERGSKSPRKQSQRKKRNLGAKNSNRKPEPNDFFRQILKHAKLQANKDTTQQNGPNSKKHKFGHQKRKNSSKSVLEKIFSPEKNDSSKVLNIKQLRIEMESFSLKDNTYLSKVIAKVAYLSSDFMKVKLINNQDVASKQELISDLFSRLSALWKDLFIGYEERLSFLETLEKCEYLADFEARLKLEIDFLTDFKGQNKKVLSLLKKREMLKAQIINISLGFDSDKQIRELNRALSSSTNLLRKVLTDMMKSVNKTRKSGKEIIKYKGIACDVLIRIDFWEIDYLKRYEGRVRDHTKFRESSNRLF